ncbi:MAG: SIR2 family protein [Candidatus Marinimicrobia bacterium]|nr:SIR2 family protein [Candidatus Neomarinimicrobiota bacterium]
MLRTVQLVKHGPELPLEVFQAQEDGNLILFCGAGVSKPAGLPLFPELVDKVFDELHDEKAPNEASAFSRHEYDRVLHLLELRYQDQDQGRVRSAVRDILDLSDAKMLATHKWLLQLAKTKTGHTRIVTTNFDRGFALAKQDSVEIDAAPKLPIPRKEKWNSIVHLHGLLRPENTHDKDLVLTSADFGAAYLMDRWASRFVSELFRNFTILFIGYGVNDPVIRYMMDAYSAEKKYYNRELGAYVLTEYDESIPEDDWESKGLTPIYYESTPSHRYLHLTLKAWAEIHSSGLQGKEKIVRSYATYPPAHRGSETVGQVSWALQEKSGHIANVFATNDPLPPIEWLPLLSSEGFLSGLTGGEEENVGIPIVDNGHLTSCPNPLSRITEQLSHWLTRHLERVEVVDFAIEKGLCLHPRFKEQIRRAIRNREIEEPYRTIWKYLSSPVYKCTCDNYFMGYRSLKPSTGDERWDGEQVLSALEHLEPVIKIGKSWHRIAGELLSDQTESDAISKLVDVDLVLRGGNPAHYFRDFAQWPVQVISDLVEQMSESLHSGWRLLQMFNELDTLNDLSYISQPSIEPHPQNKQFRDWCYLVEYLRDAWIVINEHRPDQAKILLAKWMSIDFPIFRRLALYAMSRTQLLSVREKVDYLLDSDGWWLFSIETEREKFRLLESLSDQVPKSQLERLVRMILNGPPRKMFITDLDEDEWAEIQDHSTWLLLEKMADMEYTLPSNGSLKLKKLSTKYPNWKLAEGDRDEFPSWTSSGVGYPSDFSADMLRDLSEIEIIEILKKTEHNRRGMLAAWRSLARLDRRKSFKVLDKIKISGEDWNIEAWDYALGGLSSEKIPKYFVGKLSVMLNSAETNSIRRLASSLAWFVGDISKKHILEPKSDLLKIWDTIVQHTGEQFDDAVDDYVSKALNHAQGRLTEALLQSVWRHLEKGEDNIPAWLLSRITMLATRDEFYLARVILASRMYDLFRLEREWTETYLIPRLSVSNFAESGALWEGYLWTARINPDFLDELRPYYLEILSHKYIITKRANRVFELFSIICIELPNAFTSSEKRTVLKSAGNEGIATIARVLNQQIQDVPGKPDTLWKDRVAPFIREHWPKDAAVRSERITINFVSMVLALDKEFSSAVSLITGYLVPVKFIGHIAPRSNDWPQADNNPKYLLKLLRKIIGPGTTVAWEKIREILNRIEAHNFSLASSSDYVFIDNWLRENNIQ